MILIVKSISTKMSLVKRTGMMRSNFKMPTKRVAKTQLEDKTYSLSRNLLEPTKTLRKVGL